ncbi:MAG: ribonuclease P protein component [Fimbriimonadaceae bacterium]|nr:ribonuclease P protein component [Fimbriimonadaceae bacterium]QYK58452.1 MAG: ribonuclease P protein component [Fimbriimonadaceae bacterium]
MKGPGKARFEEIFSKGQQVSSESFRLCWSSGTGQIGVATSRAIGCHARRNRQKRRALAAFAEFKQEISGIDVVLLVKARAAGASWNALVTELQGLLSEVSRRSLHASGLP